MCWSIWDSTGCYGGGGRVEEKEEVLHFQSYNIWNSHNGGLDLALRRMDQAKIDLVILQETNITSGTYMQSLARFCVVETETPNLYCGDIELFYKESWHFLVEVLQIHIPNVVSFHMVMVGHHWHVVG